jgi:TldD protein
MLEAGQLERVLTRALSSGGDYADVFIERTRPSFMALEDNNIEKVSFGSISGAGLRVLFDGRTAYATTNEISEAALTELASSLEKAVARGESGSVGSLSVPDYTADREAQVAGDVPMEQKVSLLSEANRAARQRHPAVRQVSAILRETFREIQIAASTGEIASENRELCTGIVNVVASRDSDVQTGYEPISGTLGFRDLFGREPLLEAALKAADRAEALLSAPRAKGGRMPVVIASEAGGTMIHEAIGHGLEGDLAGQGISRFSSMKGKKVASGLITVIDDPTIEGKRGSYSFDDEGVMARRNVLVDRGILLGYMHDRLSAMKEGVEPTGNGRRESYLHRPVPRMSNTFIAPGSSDPEEIIRSLDSGLLVKKMGGGQVNTVNGDFVFDVSEGYIIGKGRQGELVRGATLTGNGPEVLMAIDMVGNDLGFSIGTCGKDGQGVPVSDAMPTVRIPDIVVGGRV